MHRYFVTDEVYDHAAVHEEQIVGNSVAETALYDSYHDLMVSNERKHIFLVFIVAS